MRIPGWQRGMEVADASASRLSMSRLYPPYPIEMAG